MITERGEVFPSVNSESVTCSDFVVVEKFNMVGK